MGVPVVCGPILNRIQMFPQVVAHAEPLIGKVEDVRSSVKWQLKKVTCMNAAVGSETMTDDELKVNIMMSINFLISLLKKGWHNMKSSTSRLPCPSLSSSCDQCRGWSNPFNSSSQGVT